MLEIKNLTVSIENKLILDNLSLSVSAGKVAAIMGPNGSGKSTLAYVMASRTTRLHRARSCSMETTSLSLNQASAR